MQLLDEFSVIFIYFRFREFCGLFVDYNFEKYGANEQCLTDLINR